jgi:hypothetical protein
VVEPWRHPDEGGEITPEMAAMQARAEEMFLAILARYTAAGRLVSDSKQGSYAPRLFAEEAEAKDAGVERRSCYRSPESWRATRRRPGGVERDTPHYRRAGGRLFVSRNSLKEIERVFDFNPQTSSCGRRQLGSLPRDQPDPDGRASLLTACSKAMFLWHNESSDRSWSRASQTPSRRQRA